MRIMIAEDEEISRMLLEKFLSQYGECHTAADGLKALDAFSLSLEKKQPYDLICLDIMMPKLDGITVLKAIRDGEAQKNIPPESRAKVIMVTALIESEYVRKAFEIGCEAYIQKPIEMNNLREAMKKAGLVL